MGFCPNPVCPEQVIKRPLDEPERQATTFFCPKCERPYALKHFVDYKAYRTTTAVLSEKLERIFYQLKGDAEIILKFHKTDIRYIPKDTSEAELRSRLSRARAGGRMPAGYPLNRIMTDLQAGASARKLFENFLKA